MHKYAAKLSFPFQDEASLHLLQCTAHYCEKLMEVVVFAKVQQLVVFHVIKQNFCQLCSSHTKDYAKELIISLY